MMPRAGKFHRNELLIVGGRRWAGHHEPSGRLRNTSNRKPRSDTWREFAHTLGGRSELLGGVILLQAATATRANFRV